MNSEIPDYHKLDREELIKLLDRIRESLHTTVNADDFCMEVADLLDLDLGVPGV